MQETNFILISYGRSGSTYIINMLKSIFNQNGVFNRELFGGNSTPMKLISNPVKTVDDYFNYNIKKYPNNYIYGFKWKPYYLDKNYMNLFSYIKQNNIKIIVNYRNPLHIYVSHVKHRNNNIKARYNKSDKKQLNMIRSISVSLDIKKLLYFMKKYIKTMDNYNNFLDKYNIPHLNICYEDLSNKNKNSWITIIKFLDNNLKVDDSFIKKLKYNLDNPTSEKTTVKEDWDLILNYNEVLNSLKGTKFEKYIKKRNC